MANAMEVVDNGRKIMLNRTFKTTPDYSEPQQFKVGTLTDIQIDAMNVTTGWSAGTDSAVTIKTSGNQFEGSGCVVLSKTGTTGFTASMSKTETIPQNINNSELTIEIFIGNGAPYNKLSASGAFTIRYGSDSSNYYEWIIQKSSLSASPTGRQWNYVVNLKITSANSVTGSPNKTSMVYLFLSYRLNNITDTTAANSSSLPGDVMFDDIRIIPTTLTKQDTNLYAPINISFLVVDNCDATAGWTGNGGTIALSTTTFIEGTGSLLGTLSAKAPMTFGFYKDPTTSRDFTGKDLTFWIKIDQANYDLLTSAANTLTITYGSNVGGDYYTWTFAKTSIVVGWNYLSNMNSGNASITGAPVITAMTFFLLEFLSTTNGTFMNLDAIQLVPTSSGLFKITQPTTPIIDEAVLMVTEQALLTTQEANGYTLNDFGIFNKDGTPKMFSRELHTKIVKTSSIQLLYVEKDWLV